MLRIPRGTYNFYSKTCGKWAPLLYVSNTVITPLPTKSIGLWLRGLTNLVVEGEDSRLLMHGLMTPIAVDHSHNTTIRNLAVDFPHPSVVEVKVAVASANGKSIELQVHSENNVGIDKHGVVVFGSHGEGWTPDGTTGLSDTGGPERSPCFSPVSRV